jgi:hypothetical protein
MEPGGASVPQFIQRFQPNFPIGWNDPPAILTFLQASVIMPGYVPKAAFIDRQGVIRVQVEAKPAPDPYFTDPAKTIRASLDELLKGAPAGAKKTKKK